jgi:hypothetical protein
MGAYRLQMTIFMSARCPQDLSMANCANVGILTAEKRRATFLYKLPLSPP